MEKWTIVHILKAINSLQERNRLDKQNILSYVLQPLAQSLGYNIFNVDEVEVDTEQAGLQIQVKPDFHILFTQEPYRPLAKQNRVILHLDLDSNELKLHIQSLQIWNTVYNIDLHNPDMKTLTVVYNEVLKFIEKDKVEAIYQEKGEKMFSEIVLQKHLDEENIGNIYVHKVLEKEIMNPSKDFLELIAIRLNREYSTQAPDKLMKSIAKLNQEGIFQLIEEVVMQNQTSDTSLFAPKPTPKEKPAPAPAPEIVEVENPLKPTEEEPKPKIKTELEEYTPPEVPKEVKTELQEFEKPQAELIPEEPLFYEDDVEIVEDIPSPVSPLEKLIQGRNE